MEQKLRHRYLLNMMGKYVKDNTDGNCFVESGVKYGSAAVSIAKGIEKQGYLFDTWKNFPHFGDYDAHSSQRRIKLRKRVKGGKDTFKECKKILKNGEVDKLCKLIRGDICKTIPHFVEKHKNDLAISLIHSDSDLHDPTKITLHSLWPYLVDGGMILVHDYKTKQWPGIETSVDEFLSDKDNFLIHEFKSNVTASILIMKQNNFEHSDNFHFLVSAIENKFPPKQKKQKI